ncbi:unnamed protein product, partial [Amoebophrya sp. A120]
RAHDFEKFQISHQRRDRTGAAEEFTAAVRVLLNRDQQQKGVAEVPARVPLQPAQGTHQVAVRLRHRENFHKRYRRRHCQFSGQYREMPLALGLVGARGGEALLPG